MFKIGDFFIIIFIILIVGFVFQRELAKTMGATPLKAEILVEGVLVKEIPLETVGSPYTFTVEENPEIVFAVERGRIRFLDAPCQDKICVLKGWLEEPGDTSVCLPEKTILRVSGNASMDATTY